MFSKLTTMKIIKAIYNLSVETYDDTVDLCKSSLHISGIKCVINESILRSITKYKYILLPMYEKFSIDVLGNKLEVLPSMPPCYKIPIEIYRDDDIDEYNKYILRNIEDPFQKSILLKESIQCNAINITKFLISNGCVFNPVYIHCCWSEEMYSILNDRYHNDIVEYIRNEIDFCIRLDFHYFFRNKFVDHIIKSEFKDFNYDNYLELNDEEMSMFTRELLYDSCFNMKNYEFIGAVCNNSKPCLQYVLGYFVLNYGRYAILGFIDDGYKKLFELILSNESRLKMIHVCSLKTCVDMRENLITYYSQDVTDELGRDLCMLLLEYSEKIVFYEEMIDKDYLDNACRNILILLKSQKVNLQKADTNGKTLMNYIENISHYKFHYVQKLWNRVQNQ